jgi:hypothetical protein
VHCAETRINGSLMCFCLMAVSQKNESTAAAESARRGLI